MNTKLTTLLLMTLASLTAYADLGDNKDKLKERNQAYEFDQKKLDDHTMVYGFVKNDGGLLFAVFLDDRVVVETHINQDDAPIRQDQQDYVAKTYGTKWHPIDVEAVAPGSKGLMSNDNQIVLIYGPVKGTESIKHSLTIIARVWFDHSQTL